MPAAHAAHAVQGAGVCRKVRVGAFPTLHYMVCTGALTCVYLYVYRMKCVHQYHTSYWKYYTTYSLYRHIYTYVCKHFYVYAVCRLYNNISTGHT
jgi:hypothetical protein